MAYLVSPDFSLIIFLWLVLEVSGSNGSAAQLSTPLFDVKSAVLVFVMYLPDASLASALSLLSSESYSGSERIMSSLLSSSQGT